MGQCREPRHACRCLCGVCKCQSLPDADRPVPVHRARRGRDALAAGHGDGSAPRGAGRLLRVPPEGGGRYAHDRCVCGQEPDPDHDGIRRRLACDAGVYAESIPSGAGGRVFPELLRADLPRGGNVQLGVYGEHRHDRAGVSGAQLILHRACAAVFAGEPVL